MSTILPSYQPTALYGAGSIGANVVLGAVVWIAVLIKVL